LNDHVAIERRLSELQSEIVALTKLGMLSPQFVVWLGKLFSLVQLGFGANSNEMLELRAIAPELPSEFYDSVAGRLISLGLDEGMTRQLLAKLHQDIPEAFFKRRLHDYDEFIAALIMGLRSQRDRD
jgi:hypothetical protein